MPRQRPEHQAPADIYYNTEEAQKYTNCSRIIEIQQQLSERALELLALPADKRCLILDLGCGSGLSGQVISEHGHDWIGLDISEPMLDVAKSRELTGQLLLGDFGNGIPLRPGSIDGVISISALQWLCNADNSDHVPRKRMSKLFTSLFSAMVPGARAVFQFYPENSPQIELLTAQAIKAGFTGGIVIDFPNSTKAKKFVGSMLTLSILRLFLCLFAGGQLHQLPKGMQDTPRRKPVKKSKEWILAKKQRWRRQGREVRPDSKYTGRKRSGRQY